MQNNNCTFDVFQDAQSLNLSLSPQPPKYLLLSPDEFIDVSNDKGNEYEDKSEYIKYCFEAKVMIEFDISRLNINRKEWETWKKEIDLYLNGK